MHTGTEDEMRDVAALYALGALGQHEARSFEEHLRDGCEECAAELREFESAVAALALAAPEAEPSPDVRERLLRRVADDETRRGPAGGAERRASLPPQFTRATDFLVVRKDEGEWFETPDAGVFAKILFVDRERDTVTTLVRLDPGARITPHRHRGVEQCLILEGDIGSGGTRLGAGDFNCAMSGSVHPEIYTERGALLLIIGPESYEALGR